jgi:hypothetical protein
VEDGSMFAGGGLIPTSVEAMARYVICLLLTLREIVES